MKDDDNIKPWTERILFVVLVAFLFCLIWFEGRWEWPPPWHPN
jgi:hypothetical protein